ncbi:MFS transporter [Oceanivirga miroungae]|uniref:Major facilitator superfamily (MFS) profile domain-containing protein n=1 Tax=Oceanivirga miroungae TaxID=1130046 RepID=A0A6I8MCB4_9FUSO|nr:MFS transporter [Oceanivirga miroungae]VWL85867.1 hypothetical protein OMES3154_01152 [Oceanivirga miroungae]
MPKTFNFLLLQAAYFSLFCTSYVFLNPALAERNFTISEIGFILTFSAFLSIIFQPMVAKLINYFKIVTNKKVLISFMLISIIATIVSSLSTSLYTVTVMTIILISSLLTAQTFVYTFIFEYINSGVDINFGLTRGGGSVAFAITSLLVGIIAKNYGFSFISIVNIFLELLVLFILLSFKELKVQNIQKDEKVKNTNFNEFRKKYRKFLFFLVGVFLILATHNAFSAFLINIAKEVNRTSSFVGFSFFLAAMLELPVMSYFNYFRKKYTNYVLIYIAVISFTVKAITLLIGLVLKDSNIILLSQFMQMFGFAVYLPASVFYVNRIMDDKDKIIGQAYLGVAGTLGSIFSGYVGAKLIESFGTTYMVLSFTLISLIGTIIIIMNLEKEH